MNRKIRNLVLVLFMLIGLLIQQVPTFAIVETYKDIAIIVPDDVVVSSREITNAKNVSYDIIPEEEIDYSNFSNYNEVAAYYPISRNTQNILIKCFEEGKKIYLYGKLTISDFSKALKLSKYGVNVNIHEVNMNSDSTELKKAFMSFDPSYEQNEIQNVVALKKNSSDGLLVTIPHNSRGGFDIKLLLKAVLDDVTPAGLITPYATLVDSEYNYRSYDGVGNFVNLDWLLYKQTESDPSYDYFGSITNSVGLTE